MIDIAGLIIEHGNKKILNIGALQLADKGAIALIGPNGSGKTTFIKCLTGIQKISPEAKLLLNNKPLRSYSNRERAQLLGYIPQSFNPCWNQTVLELITLAASRATLADNMFEGACRQFELTALLSHHWDVLSGGEKARVLAAMAFMGNPPLLVADEPGAALDIKHRLQLIERLAEYGEQQLAIVCLHELDLVFRFFKYVILLNEGEIVYYGDTERLFNNELLDRTFDVKFKRIRQDGGYLLYPEA